VTGLRRYARRAPVVSLDHPAARCEMCGAVLGRHAHVAALAERELRCVCRPCGLLFTPDGAGAGRIRTVPERYLIDPAHPVSGADWDLLQIPAMPVFLFDNSELGRVVACYPSPAGATESLLDLGEWARLRLAYPLLREPAADVEAVFVTRSSAGLETYLADRRLLRRRGHGPAALARAGRGSGSSRGHDGVPAESARAEPVTLTTYGA
jgi:hypothetical protein